MKSILFTCGDINGIGPEIIFRTLNKICQDSEYHFIVFCPHIISEKISKIIQPEFAFENVSSYKNSCVRKNFVSLVDTSDEDEDLISGYHPGSPSAFSGKVAYRALRTAYNCIEDGYSDVLVTAPISKYALRMAGIKYPGHTEMLADWAGTDDFLMTFLSEKLKCTMISIHEPIKNVSPLITRDRIFKVLQLVVSSMKKDFSISKPSVAILGLNPHAGENGLIGSEENEISGAIAALNYNGIIEGPFPADAFFARSLYSKFDITIGMYHDQILIPFKMLDAGRGVNFTSGLPFIRTSPDHGTAYDIADSFTADESSMIAAYKYAVSISKNRGEYEGKV